MTRSRSALEQLLIHLDGIERQLDVLDAELTQIAQTQRRGGQVEILTRFRGINTLTALGLIAEIGDFARFSHPRELASWLDITPIEYSSGDQQHRGHITKAGNTHARRLLVEVAWHYRHPPRRPTCGAQPDERAWQAQVRLHHRYRHLTQHGKRTTVTNIAIARELVGFLWAAMTDQHCATPTPPPARRSPRLARLAVVSARDARRLRDRPGVGPPSVRPASLRPRIDPVRERGGARPQSGRQRAWRRLAPGTRIGGGFVTRAAGILACIAATIVFAAAAHGQVATVDLLTDAGTQIDGAAADDHAGMVGDGEVDFNLDLNDDALVGAYSASPLGRSRAGSAWVLLGRQPPLVDLATVGPSAVRIDGEAADDRTGISIAAAGDVNGDSIDDVIVGADGAGPLGRSDAGTAWVVFGGSTAPVDLAALGARGFRIDGPAPGVTAGWSVDGAGNVNGDEYDDLIVGVPYNDYAGRNLAGSAYIVFGKPDATPVDLANLGAGGYPIHGAAADDVAGTSVAGAGNVDGDAYADVIVGAPGADSSTGAAGAGAAYVVFGKNNTTPVDLAGLGSAGYRISGSAADDSMGYSVDNAGDVNRDGRQDQIVGAPGAGAGVEGAATIVYGKAATSGKPAAAIVSYDISGAAPNDGTGYKVAGVGDVSGDLRADQVIGAPDADNGGRATSGSAYVVYGLGQAASVYLSTYTSTSGYRIDGPAAGSGTGRSVGGPGDAGGDRGGDVFVGAPFNAANGRIGSGSSYLVYGVSALRIETIRNLSVLSFSWRPTVRTARAAQLPRRAPIHYRLTQPARVTMTLYRELSGRTRGRFRVVAGVLRDRVRCVPGAAQRRRGERRCRRFVRVGSFVRDHRRAGRQRVRFGGTLAARRLAPGGYVLVVTARERGGRVHGPKRARFRVLR